MEEKMIRLIVSDIDGTLLPEGATNLNPEYFDVIRRLADHGVHFAAASGRQLSSVRSVFQSVEDCIGYITDNGAYVLDKGKSVLERDMCRKDLQELLQSLKGLPEAKVVLSNREGFYLDQYDEFMCHLLYEEYRGSGGVLDSFDDYLDTCLKISLYFTDDSSIYYPRIREEWSDRFAVNISGAKWIDICDKESTKGNAVRWFQQNLGVTPEETVVFGDNFNDVTMLHCAERSYASVLSHPDVKKEARYTVASYEEDGVLKVLRQILEEIEAQSQAGNV